MRPLCLAASVSVRATSMHHFEYWAPLVHTFWPVTTHSSPFLTARVFSRREVRAGVGLGEALAPDLLGREDRRQVALLLLVGAPHHQRRARPAAARACWRPAARGRGRSPRSRSPIRSAWRRARRTPRATREPPSRRRRGAAASPCARRSWRPRSPSTGSGSGGLSASQERSSSRKAVSLGLKVRSIGALPNSLSRIAKRCLRRRERR